MTSNANSSQKLKIVVCGGGNAAHVFLGLAASDPNIEAHLFSLFQDEAVRFQTALQDKESNPDGTLKVNFVQEKKTVASAPVNFTNDPAKCLPGADLVIISLPTFAHAQYLNMVTQHVGDHKCQVAVFPGGAGLEYDWKSLVAQKCEYASKYTLVSCITLPWATRIQSYGQAAEVLGTKASVAVCVVEGAEGYKAPECIEILGRLIGEAPKITDDGHIMSMSLGAVNGVVHPSVMYCRWKDWDGVPVKEKPLFYQGLTEEAASVMSSLSSETLEIGKRVTEEAGVEIKLLHIYDWYVLTYGEDAEDSSSLYSVIHTNPGYNGLVHPMKVFKDENENKQAEEETYVPNFGYRYLTEDIPHGLCVFKGIAMCLPNPPKTDTIDTIIQWAQKVMNKSYFVYEEGSNKVVELGPDIKETRAPQKYGFKTVKDII